MIALTRRRRPAAGPAEGAAEVDPLEGAPSAEASPAAEAAPRRGLGGLALRRGGSAPKASQKVSFVPADRSRRGRWFGVDIDGTAVRVAEVRDGTAVAFTVFHADTVAASFRQFLATKPAGTVIVAWSAPNLFVKQLPLPAMPLEALRAAVLDELEPDLPFPAANALTSIRVVEADDGSQTAIAAVAEADAVTALWGTLDSSELHLVPTPLLYDSDGLYLGLRGEDAQLTLVTGGAVAMSRPLVTGGLRQLFQQLDPDVSVAAQRFGTVARGGARLDPDATTAVEGYASRLGDEVRRTVDFWVRQGHTVPSEVRVHGPGIVVPNLAGRLLDAALFAKPVHFPDLGLDAIARNERPMAFTALLAASFDVRTQVLAGLPDPRAAAAERLRREQSKRSKRLGAVAGAVVLAGAVLYLPVRSAESKAADAEQELADITQQASSLAAVRSLNAKVKSATESYRKVIAVEPNWPVLIRQVLESSPTQGAAVRAISFSVNDRDRLAVLEFSASIPGPNFRVTVSDWLREFERRGAIKPWSGSFSSTCVGLAPGAAQPQPIGSVDSCPSGQQGQVTAAFRVPFPLTGDFVVNRPIPGAPAGSAGTGSATPGSTPATTAVTATTTKAGAP